VEDNAFVQIELGLENEDEPNDVSQIRPTLQALSSPNMWIGDTGSTQPSTDREESIHNPCQAGPGEFMGKQ
jgi:hypothetical protein